jgi:hypothetical protein
MPAIAAAVWAAHVASWLLQQSNSQLSDQADFFSALVSYGL